MTREEFISDIYDFADLKQFCWENGVCEEDVQDIIDDDQLDEYVNDDVNNTGRSWRDLRDALNDIPVGYPWYRCNGSFDYDGLTESDFIDMKQEILDCLDRDGFFDEEEEEPGPDPFLDIDLFDLDPDEEEPEPEPDPGVPPLDMGLLGSLCSLTEAAAIANRRPAPPPPPPVSPPEPRAVIGDLSELLPF